MKGERETDARSGQVEASSTDGGLEATLMGAVSRGPSGWTRSPPLFSAFISDLDEVLDT